MKLFENIALVVCLMCIGLLGYQYLRPDIVDRTTASKRTVASDLRSYNNANSLSKLSFEDQFKVKNAVQFFCSTHYHKESCIHYLLICAQPCFASIDPENRNTSITTGGERLIVGELRSVVIFDLK